MLEKILEYHILKISQDQAATSMVNKCTLVLTFRSPAKKKKNAIIKTNEPGPGSYNLHETVGVIPEYNRYETHPREEG